MEKKIQKLKKSETIKAKEQIIINKKYEYNEYNLYL